MKVAIRVDASAEIGTGHLMRCLTLADALASTGAQSFFILGSNSGAFKDVVVQRKHNVIIIPAPPNLKPPHDTLAHSGWLKGGWEYDSLKTQTLMKDLAPDCLIIDHYGIDSRWLKHVTPYSKMTMAIDDLADRALPVDILLNQNEGSTPEQYVGLVRPDTKFLCGAQYALLRPEFRKYRAASLERRVSPQLKNILVNFGGTDPDNFTGRVINALSIYPHIGKLTITIVMGKSAPWTDHVTKQAEKILPNSQVKIGVENMAAEMLIADLAIGAAGSSSWERCVMGLPSIIMEQAANQRSALKKLHQLNAAIKIQEKKLNSALSTTIDQLYKRPSLLRSLSINASVICDGLGTSRVTKLLIGHMQ